VRSVLKAAGRRLEYYHILFVGRTAPAKRGLPEFREPGRFRTVDAQTLNANAHAIDPAKRGRHQSSRFRVRARHLAILPVICLNSHTQSRTRHQAWCGTGYHGGSVRARPNKCTEVISANFM
jgi:hypothetical protein